MQILLLPQEGRGFISGNVCIKLKKFAPERLSKVTGEQKLIIWLPFSDDRHYKYTTENSPHYWLEGQTISSSIVVVG